MVSATELIEALQRRLRLLAPQLRRPPGEFPPGWQTWLETLREHPGKVTGASAGSLVAILAQRPLAMPPRRLRDLTNWQAFSTMFRQDWRPPAPEDRRWRWFAGSVSGLWHLLFGALLLWLMYVHYLPRPSQEGESVVQIELIGVGTPQEPGGGAVAEPAQDAEAAPPGHSQQADSPARPTSPPPPPASVAVVTPTPAASPPEVAPSPLEPEPAPAEQALSVSEPVPDRSEEFVLPPPLPRVAVTAVATPELRAPVPTVQVVEIPMPLPSAQMDVRPSAVTVPALAQRVPDVAEREIPAPLPRVPTVAIAEPTLSTPDLRAQLPQVRTATIPAPESSASASASATAAAARAEAARSAGAAAAAVDAAQSAAAPSSTPAPPSGRSPAAAAGAGPRPTPAPGGWTTPNRADDWGDAARNRPGAQRGDDGLYNSDGSVRLAAPSGSASPGDPPGTVTQQIANLDRAGTWLKRGPVGYDPSAFDRYWRPNETLLEEWVRKSITTVRIPIPGTNKHIVCQTVLLALGGGCGISDPNLNEQPATARPPPDIPFKPELQEDNGSIRPPPGG